METVLEKPTIAPARAEYLTKLFKTLRDTRKEDMLEICCHAQDVLDWNFIRTLLAEWNNISPSHESRFLSILSASGIITKILNVSEENAIPFVNQEVIDGQVTYDIFLTNGEKIANCNVVDYKNHPTKPKDVRVFKDMLGKEYHLTVKSYSLAIYYDVFDATRGC